MAITKENLATLQFPFKANEHEFLKNNAYITEAAITRRIEIVDPSWTLEQISLYHRPDAGSGKPIVICTMRMTINGVWRDGVGMNEVNLTKNGNSEANEAEKSAATDAMKRAARLFGIGRYLLDLPSSVVDVPTMRNYLVATYANTPDPFGAAAVNPPQPLPSVGNQSPAPTTASAPARNGSEPLPEWVDREVRNCWAALKIWLVDKQHYKNDFEMQASFKKRGIATDHGITAAWASKPARELIAFVKARHEQDDVDFMADGQVAS